jgi:hypothetical protein
MAGTSRRVDFAEQGDDATVPGVRDEDAEPAIVVLSLAG